MKPPRCFISYSWDSEQHRKWVRMLATRLRDSGIDAILDQFDCAPGMDLTNFMEKSVRESNFVLLICTPNFAKKADAGVGGVGYEKAIVTGEIFAGETMETKFIPLLREGEAKESLPSYLKSRLYIDFRGDDLFENRLEQLLRHFYGDPVYPKPPIGRKPNWQKGAISDEESKTTATKLVKKPKAFKSTKKTTVTQSLKEPTLPKKFKNSIGMEFVLIPAGTFMMGSELSSREIVRKFGGNESWYEGEHPRHKVTIKYPFYLQTTPVTQDQWKEVMGNNPSFFQNCGGDCPVEGISWNSAKEFINRLNVKENSAEYRLPSEANWQYACRAGTSTEYFFGDTARNLRVYAWYEKNSDGKTHTVRNRKPNPWGLYDILGNVREWVEDDGHYWEKNSYDGAPTDGSAWIDKPRGDHRVVCGGGWGSEALRCRSAYRQQNFPNLQFKDIGIRLAKSVAIMR